MKSLALFSVFPPGRCGIADYSRDLVAALARHFEITCYVADGERPEGVAPLASIESHGASRGREDHTLYQVGNSADLGFVLPHLVRHPGAVTLHDACQYDLTYDYFCRRPLRFALETFRSLPAASRRALASRLSRDPRQWRRQILEAYSAHPEKRSLFPFTAFVLRHASRLIVHSRHLADLASRLRPGLEVDVVPFGVDAAPARDRGECRRFLREELGVPAAGDTPLFLTFGALQPHKRITAVLQALQHFVRERPDALYLLVGRRDVDYDVDAELAARGLAGHVRIVEQYLPMPDVYQCVQAADLCFNLRWPSYGSTSSTLYKILAAGAAAAITPIEACAEVPEDLVFSIPPPGEEEGEACLELMRSVARDPERAALVGERARRWILESCGWERTAAAYARALETPRPAPGQVPQPAGGGWGA